MRSLVLPLLLAACTQEIVADGLSVRADWTEADRVGTMPDFYEQVPRNILMISVDTFRRDHIGALGGPRNNTPTLDALIEGGVVWADHTTCSNWTYAGVTCTLRGAYNVDNQFIPKIAEATRRPVPIGSEFASTWLGRAGFFTAAHSGNSWYSGLWGNLRDYDQVVKGDKSNALALSSAGLQAIDRHQSNHDDPWFLHVHLMEPHTPYAPPDQYIQGLGELGPMPFDFTDKDVHYEAVNDAWPQMDDDTRDLLEQHLRIRYRGEIQWWDAQLADVLIEANARGLLDDTLVVLWSDHGEQFWEHGFQTHAYSLHREENDGWVVFWSKNIVPERWEEPTVSVDIVPTLLALHDIELPEAVTGLPMGHRDPHGPRYATTVARLGALQSVRLREWKMIYRWAGGVRVYDLASDPAEEHDLFDPEDPMTRELWSWLGPWAVKSRPLAPEFVQNPPPGL